MLRKIILSIFVLILLSSNLTVSQIKAATENFRSDQTMVIQAKPADRRALILKDYFAKYNSPLEDSAQDFIDAADTYGVDWKLVPAISGVESTFGKFTPGGYEPGSPSYNGWGWGVYGDQSLGFKSWKDGIFTVTKGLKENYINKGLTEPYAMNRVYAASPTWGYKVNYFIADLEKFERNYTVALSEVSQTEKLPVTAGLTPKLANAEQQFKLNFLD